MEPGMTEEPAGHGVRHTEQRRGRVATIFREAQSEVPADGAGLWDASERARSVCAGG